MTRRRALLLGTAGVVAALALAVWVGWPRTSAITKENVAKIKDGMTQAEVEVILGGAARDDSDGLCSPFYPPVAGLPIYADHAHSDQWIGPDCAVWIMFYSKRDDRVLVGSMLR